MLTHASRVFLPVAAAAFVLMLAYAAFTGDLLGVTLLFMLTGAAAFVSVVVAGAADRTALAPALSGEGTGPEGRPPQPGGGGWPMLLAVAIALMVVSFVLGPLAAYAGLLLAAVAAAGWMGRTSAERSGREANLLPLGLPVIGLLAIASLMFFMSRILLAVSELGSTIVSLAVAVVIMVVASVVALRPAVSSRTLTVLLVLGTALMVGGGLVAAAAGERRIEHHAEEGHGGAGEGEGSEGGALAPPGEAVPVIVASNLMFDKAELTFKAGAEVKLVFDNKDNAVPHNVAVYTSPDLSKEIFRGELVTGVKEVTYHFPAPEPGSYFFHCDVHPTMKGKVTVS